jgi:hypothetical protein
MADSMITRIIPPLRAKTIGHLVGIDEASVQDILQGWQGNPLEDMTDKEIARAITKRLDDIARNP